MLSIIANETAFFGNSSNQSPLLFTVCAFVAFEISSLEHLHSHMVLQSLDPQKVNGGPLFRYSGTTNKENGSVLSMVQETN